MSRRRIFVSIIFIAFASVGAAQTVIVTPKRVVYKRTGRDVPKWKRTFELRYPVFSGGLTAKARRNLKEGTDYWRLFDQTLAENLKDDHWLSSFDYIVKYNKHNILDIELVMEGVGAYPDGETKYLVFDTRTGRRLNFPDLFESARLPDLLLKIRAVMKRKEAAETSGEIREMLASNRENEPDFYPTPDKIDLDDLDGFSINDRGVTFIYDYGYAHVAQALEPSGNFFISYPQLRSVIRRDGLLARFIR